MGPDPLELGGLLVVALEGATGDRAAVPHEQQQSAVRGREPLRKVFAEFEVDVVEDAVVPRRIFAGQVGEQWPDPRIRLGDPDEFGHGGTCSGKEGEKSAGAFR